MNKRNNIVIGLIFVALGLMFMLNNMKIFNIFEIFDIGFLMSYFWATLFIIIPSILMHSAYFSGRKDGAGILVPAGILLGVGVTCQISMLFNLWGVLWPGFILSVALGLFELYLFGTREKGLLIPVGILSGLSLIFFTTISLKQLHLKGYIVPVVFILAGIMIMFKDSFRRKEF